ncbi:NAD(P)-binding protein, partial [Aulographum hederae CBS 113979]
MPPTRLALIGLSASAKTAWAAEAHLPYLLSPHGRSHYTLTALLNSSTAAAEAAKCHFNLPASVKAYGDPVLLAQDEDIDLVVCCTRVDTHAATIEPAIRAGKTVLVEWPIAENVARAASLGAAAEESGVEVLVGLQTRFNPIVLKLKEMLTAGDIGRVLSSEVLARTTRLPRDAVPEGLAYFAERRVGGNPMTIAYAHTIDYVHDVLGEFDGFDARLQVQRPEMGLFDAGGVVKGSVVSDVPDFVAVHGKLAKGRAEIAEDATLAVRLRTGQPFKGDPGFVWTINGEKGEIKVTSPLGPYLQLDLGDEPIRIELNDFAKDEVVEVEWDWKEWQKKLPVPARMMGELYEVYA